MTRRIERAMALLRRGDLSVTESCFEVGCSSLGTFSSRFTELVGVPPSTYRREALEPMAGMPLRGEEGDQTDQESRSGGREPHLASSRQVANNQEIDMTAMDITIYQALLPNDDPDATLTFYRDTLGFEVRNDVEYRGMHWITVGPAPARHVHRAVPAAATPGITEDERRTIAEMMAKGTYASINLATADVDGTFERLQAGDAEVVQEPTDQPYGLRDCAFRDPAGNLLRIQEVS
jgi:uncharacterized glyoxalase superfamily protein PhnB